MSTRAFLLTIISFFSFGAFAQPSDAQVIKDLSGSGVLKVELSSGTTKKSWNSVHAQYFWERGATVWRSADVAEYPNAKIKIVGFARYHYGTSSSFREFKVTDNEYFGLPAPSKDEMIGMIRERYMQFLGYRVGDMVSDLKYLRIPEGSIVTWHRPTSFTIPVEVEYEAKSSYTEISTYHEVIECRFYRETVSSPWKENMITSGRTKETLSTKTYTAEQLNAMPSMRDQLEEKAASKRATALPTLSIPEFKSDMDLFLYTHKMLREATSEQFQAYMMQVLSPGHFVEGSTVRLNQRGADVINSAIAAAYGGTSTYKEQYCADPGVKHQQAGMMEWWNATTDKKTRCAASLYGGAWKNGQKAGESYKLDALEVWMWTDADNIARISSYEPGVLCKGAKPAQTVPPIENAKGASVNEGSGTKTNEVLKKGKNLLNKLKLPK